MTLYLLFESAIGYALFQKLEFDEMNAASVQLQKAISKMETFSKMVRLKAFSPFHNADKALSNALALAEGKPTEDLKSFLEMNLPQGKKNKKATLAVLDKILAGNLSQEANIEIQTGEVINELFRGIRTHFHDFLKNKESDIVKANLGLGHSFSRNRVSLDINRQDKHIIQSIAILDQLDKNLNTFCMRVKEWYSWHFPELAKQVTDNQVFIQLVDLIGNKTNATEEMITDIEEIVKDGELAKSIFESIKTSMGQDLTEIDAQSISSLVKRVLGQFELRTKIQTYLKNRMKAVAPNLTSLIGENVGAKLISQAGSLVSLAKYPASTVQILGAEKALFRALKTKGNTPKYGLLYHSSFISRAATKDKGKISRYVANKCSLAARIDQFLIMPTEKFGEKMKKQVEERLKFLETGESQTKNEDIMAEVLNELRSENLYVETEKVGKKKKDKKQKKKKVVEIEEEEPIVEKVTAKKRKAKAVVEEIEEEEVEPVQKKKKKTK